MSNVVVARQIADDLSVLLQHNRVGFMLVVAGLPEAALATLTGLISEVYARSNFRFRETGSLTLIEKIGARLEPEAREMLLREGWKFGEPELDLLDSYTEGRPITAKDIDHVLGATREARQQRTAARVFSPAPPKKRRARRKAGE